MGSFSSGSMDLNPADLAEDVHRLFDDLSKRRPDRRQLVAGECMPVVDVFETDKNVEIVVDLPGVSAEAVRVLFKAGVVIIVGEKERPDLSKRAPASFHLVERDFGRFARAVRISVAIDGARASGLPAPVSPWHWAQRWKSCSPRLRSWARAGAISTPPAREVRTASVQSTLIPKPPHGQPLPVRARQRVARERPGLPLHSV